MPVDGKSRPQHLCHGHTDEGYGLSWNPNIEGELLSGSSDGKICIWNTRESSCDLQPLSVRSRHNGSVEDVDWHRRHYSIFGSVGDDGKLIIWDTRESPDKSTVETEHAHEQEANCISFNPHNEFYLSTGGSDGIVALWDLRKMSSCTHQFKGHSDGVYQVQWSPFSESVLASSSSGIILYASTNHKSN
jgi:histone-binding protein RBBP4